MTVIAGQEETPYNLGESSTAALSELGPAPGALQRRSRLTHAILMFSWQVQR